MRRRDFIKMLPMLFVGLSVGESFGSNLEPKSAVHYQNYPKDGEMCRMCKFFIPPNSMGNIMGMMGGMRGMMKAKCKVVAGDISPMGWCMLFQQKT